MALVVKDRVRVSSVTAGTGALTLGAAVSGFQDFSVIGNGNTTYYTIVDPTTGAWEVGIGTYNSTGPTLSRDTVLESSNAGSLVSFLSNPKDVFVTYPAERSVYVEGTAIVPATTARLAFSNLTQGSALSVLGVSGNAAADVASIAAASDHQVLRRNGTGIAFGAIALNQSNAVTGTLGIGNGGTGLTATPTNGQIDIGNGTGFTRATLTQGTGITITNGSGSITVANAGVTSFSAGTTGLTPSTATTGAVSLGGTLAVGNGGTGQTSYTNGQLLIGNTTGNTLTKATLTAGTAISVTNGSGSITIANTGVTSLTGTANQVTVSASTGGVTLSLPASINVNTTGSAATLTTSRNINGVAFNGSADITVPVNTSQKSDNVAYQIPFVTNVTAGNQSLFTDSAANITYNPSTNTLTTTTFSGALSGNATTATTLQTARNINGTSFNGSADITTANWGTARTLWGQSVNGSANITAPLLPAAGTVGAPAFSTSGDTNTGIFFPAADTIAIAEGGVEVVRVDSSSNVGVGTTTPGEKLDVNGSVRGTQVIASNGIFVNSQTVSANYTVPSGSNAMSAGAVTVASGITVTVSSGSVWTIV